MDLSHNSYMQLNCEDLDLVHFCHHSSNDNHCCGNWNRHHLHCPWGVVVWVKLQSQRLQYYSDGKPASGEVDPASFVSKQYS